MTKVQGHKEKTQTVTGRSRVALSKTVCQGMIQHDKRVLRHDFEYFNSVLFVIRFEALHGGNRYRLGLR